MLAPPGGLAGASRTQLAKPLHVVLRVVCLSPNSR